MQLPTICSAVFKNQSKSCSGLSYKGAMPNSSYLSQTPLDGTLLANKSCKMCENSVMKYSFVGGSANLRKNSVVALIHEGSMEGRVPRERHIHDHVDQLMHFRLVRKLRKIPVSDDVRTSINNFLVLLGCHPPVCRRHGGYQNQQCFSAS